MGNYVSVVLLRLPIQVSSSFGCSYTMVGSTHKNKNWRTLVHQLTKKHMNHWKNLLIWLLKQYLVEENELTLIPGALDQRLETNVA